MSKYTREYLLSKPYDELTKSENAAAMGMHLYPKGYGASLPCFKCKERPRWQRRRYCWDCYRPDRIKILKDKCSCGNLKTKTSKRCNKCFWRDNNGPNSIAWQGGRRTKPDGYVTIWMPDHPNAVQNSVREHILVMENSIGRYLYPEETVHHKNGMRGDNRIENLELWSSNHPGGQRVEDLVNWCKDLMRQYPEHFADLLDA